MSAEQKHTPEPWPAPDTVKFRWGQDDDDLSGGVLSLRDYMRARSCVNACVGMADPAAAIQRLRDFAHACADAWDGDTDIPMVNQARHALGELETLADDEACTLRHQRDELLAALRVVLFAARDGAVLERDAAHAQARAAIAKVQP